MSCLLILKVEYNIHTLQIYHLQSAKVVETLAYDLVLESAMRAQHFHAHKLQLDGPWKWLLHEFADFYGVSDSYTKLRYFQIFFCYEPDLRTKLKYNFFLKTVI